jgi:hypothetical protein
MSFSFLIDECLSPELAQLAVAKGHVTSTCVRDRGWTGKKDWELMPLIIEHDFTLVTKNNVDFRGAHPPTPSGLYAGQELHAGLVCLNLADNEDKAEQIAIFELALDYLADHGSLFNQVLEIYVAGDGEATATVYDLPHPIR